MAAAAGATTEATAAPRSVLWWPLAVLSLALTYGVVRLRTAALAECNVGINAGTAGLGVLGGGILMLAVCLVGTALVVRLAPSRAVATALALLLLAICAWVLLATTSAPDGYPSAVRTCTANVPHWWPVWLPR